jgi:hypothetical protein
VQFAFQDVPQDIPQAMLQDTLQQANGFSRLSIPTKSRRDQGSQTGAGLGVDIDPDFLSKSTVIR